MRDQLNLWFWCASSLTIAIYLKGALLQFIRHLPHPGCSEQSYFGVGSSFVGICSGGPPDSLMVQREIEVTVRSTPRNSRILRPSALSLTACSALSFAALMFSRRSVRIAEGAQEAFTG